MKIEEKNSAVKWCYKPVWIFVGILAVGPLAIPLVWLSPALKKWHKIAITIALAAITIWMVKATADIYRSFMKEMAALQNAYNY
ncbi:MAG: hypothetical protein WC522_03150 [Candidatus Omnitrophota bacterium]